MDQRYPRGLSLLSTTMMLFRHLSTLAASQLPSSPISPRLGLHPGLHGRYPPSMHNFTCLDGSQTIAASRVNDNYCDCNDHSDEPGTSACSGGWFYCLNQGYRPKNISSMLVNDGICDCCDGGDEREGFVQCSNTCRQLRDRELQENAKQAELIRRGLEIKQSYIAEGMKRRDEWMQKIVQLRQAQDEKEAEFKLTEEEKQRAEKTEKDAIDEYNRNHPPEIPVDDVQQSGALDMFNSIDVNKDAKITTIEIVEGLNYIKKTMMDVISKPEAISVLSNGMTFDEFQRTVYSKIFKPDHSQMKGFSSQAVDDDGVTEETPGSSSSMPAATVASEELETDQARANDNDDDNYADDYEEAELTSEERGQEKHTKREDVNQQDHISDRRRSGKVAKTESSIEYDAETKTVIDVANSAREKYNKVRDSLNSLRSEVDQLQAIVDMDFGTNKEFAALYDKEILYTGNRYSYKLVMFKRVDQLINKHNNKVSIGKWGRWEAGDGLEPYRIMRYDNGDRCWQGPQRSTTVHFTCGLEDRIVSISEPSKCTYFMNVESPAVCVNESEAGEQRRGPAHDEL